MEKTIQIGNASLTIKTQNKDDQISMKELFVRLEKEIIQHYLNKNSNNKNVTSKELCLERTTLVEKCRRFGLFMNPAPEKRIKRKL